MKITRPFLFVLVLIYFIGSSPSHLLALDMIFNQGKSRADRGIIYLSSIPSGATVYINGRKFREKTPTIIPNLPMGNYRIKFTCKDYKNWEKVVPVEKQKATSLEDILLVPNVWPGQQLAVNFDELLTLNGYPSFLLKKGPALQDLYFYKNEYKNETVPSAEFKEQNIFSFADVAQSFKEAKIINLFFSTSSPLFIVEIKQEGKIKFLQVNLKEGKSIFLDITARIGKQIPEKFLWFKENGQDLFMLKSGQLKHLDLGKGLAHPILLRPPILPNSGASQQYSRAELLLRSPAFSRAKENNMIGEIKGLGLAENEIYVLSKDNVFSRFDFKGKNPQVLLKTPELTKKLFASSKNFDIYVFQADIIVFLSNKGALLSNQLPHEFVEKGVEGIQFDEENLRLLFWTSSDIGYIDFKNDQEDKLFEEGPPVKWLDVKAKGIGQAFWANHGGNIIYSTTKEVFITETESFGQPTAHKITDIKAKTSIAYDQATGKVFYLAPSGALNSITVIP